MNVHCMFLIQNNFKSRFFAKALRALVVFYIPMCLYRHHPGFHLLRLLAIVKQMY